MLDIPDRISMDELSKLWIDRALKAIEAERQSQQSQKPKDKRQE